MALNFKIKLQDFVDITSNPFDQGHNMIGLDNKIKKTRYQKQRQKVLDRINAEKDPEITAELKKGNTVEIIQD